MLCTETAVVGTGVGINPGTDFDCWFKPEILYLE